MKTISRSGLVACLLLLILVLGTPVDQSHAGKPKPPPPLPPIRYQIQFWDLPLPNSANWSLDDMNNLGQIVGWYMDALGEQRAYLYDPLADQDSAIDLEATFGSVGVPAGWKIASAVGINDFGVIVGYLSPIGSPYAGGGSRQGFVLDTRAETPQVVVLDWAPWSDTYARKINENGDILGAYTNPDGSSGLYFYNPADPTTPLFFEDVSLDDVSPVAYLNNPLRDAGGNVIRPAQVGGTFAGSAQAPFRWTPQSQSNQLETFGGLTTIGGVRGISDEGTLCGSTSSGRPSKTYPMRLKTSVQLLSNAYGLWGMDINSTKDVLLSSVGYGGGVYRDDWGAYGYYGDLSKLVVESPGSGDLGVWTSAQSLQCTHMNDHGSITNAGQISGHLNFSDGSAIPFILNPILAP